MEKSSLVYIMLTIITVGFALLIRNKEYVACRIKGGYDAGTYKPTDCKKARNLVAEFVIYALLAGVSACRIAVGNDYWEYRFNFRLIAQERHVSSEFGFNMIVKWIQMIFGYDHYLPVFGFFSLITVFFFVKALHDQATDYAMSLFLLMTGGYYFNSLNTVRYYLALAIALYSIKYLLRTEILKFILLVVWAGTFHKTVLVVIPVFLVAYFLAVKGPAKWQIPFGIAMIGGLIFGKDLIRKVIFKIYPQYLHSGFDNGRIPFINVGKCLILIVLAVLVLVLHKEKWSIPVRFYFILTLFALASLFCGSYIPEVSRIAYYMMVTQIFLIPEFLGMLDNKRIRLLCRYAVILGFTMYFALMLKKMYSLDIRLLPYMNWIFD